MKAIGIDIGTTSVCGVLLDAQSGELLASKTKNSNAFLAVRAEWERIQSVEKIIAIATEIIDELIDVDVAVIGVTGQMHGIVYTDENGTQDYATGCRLDFSIYSGTTKINIPLSEYDENGEIVAYSELEQIFVDNGFVRIETSETFLDVDFENFLAYEVNFDTLSYVIMD